MIRNIQIQPALAQRLAAAIARFYHAVPISEEAGRITVAMVNPDDQTAVAAVKKALGCEPYVVRGDQTRIDAAIDQIWPYEIGQAQPPSILLQADDHEFHRKNGNQRQRESEVYEFAQKLTALLSAKLTLHTAGAKARSDAFDNSVNQEHYDLVVGSTFTRSDLRRIPTSIFVVQQPSWPLKRILLLINGETVGDAALSWVVLLAKRTGAGITALAIVPPVPAMFQGFSRMQQGLPELLSANTGLGKQTRKIAKRLFDEEIDGTNKLRYGSPESQYVAEIAEGRYDTAVIAGESKPQRKRWPPGDLIVPLLQRSQTPVLIAKSM
ncbi:MAG TPA: universal stress protein [Anaerolineales bacterium]|nr:universal stress protein [Anaerolineales bacterium]